MTDRMLCRFPVYLLVRMVIDFEAIGKPRAVGVVQPKTWERRTGGVGASKTVPKWQKQAGNRLEIVKNARF
jgi:hypothetical protein